MSRHIIYNGELVKNKNNFDADHPLIQGTNALRFEWFVRSSALPFYQDEFRRLAKVANKKGLKLPGWLTASTFAQDIHHLLQMNRIYQGGLLRMVIYSDSPGKEASYLMMVAPKSNQRFILNEEGFLIDVFRRHRLYSGSAEIYDTGLSATETSALFDMHAGKYDQMVLLNEVNHVARFIGANFMLVSDDTAYTPALEEGAIDDIMRQKTIEACLNLKLKVFDDCIIHNNDLKSAGEIMVLHPFEGIRWVVGYQDKRYFRRHAQNLNDEINRLFFGEGMY
ncbi:MAG: aminotransferase class IV [Bacteroidota bacterium]